MFFQNDMNRLFDQFFTLPANSTEESNWLPAFDVRENKDQLIFEAALPGMDKKEIDIKLHDGVLTVTAERVQPEIDEDTRLHAAELHYGKFSRSFSIGSEVDEDKVEAKYKNGILTIVLKKLDTKDSVGRHIEVK
jgi:HSP20 family protein